MRQKYNFVTGYNNSIYLNITISNNTHKCILYAEFDMVNFYRSCAQWLNVCQRAKLFPQSKFIIKVALLCTRV